MKFDPLATACGLYCGSCRYYMNDECKGCGTADREGCNLYECCRKEKQLQFCAECNDFPCEHLRTSIGLHPKWLEDQAQFPPKKWS